MYFLANIATRATRTQLTWDLFRTTKRFFQIWIIDLSWHQDIFRNDWLPLLWDALPLQQKIVYAIKGLAFHLYWRWSNRWNYEMLWRNLGITFGDEPFEEICNCLDVGLGLNNRNLSLVNGNSKCLEMFECVDDESIGDEEDEVLELLF